MNTKRDLSGIHTYNALVFTVMISLFPIVVTGQPTQSPPNGNTEPPINVGSTAQVKSGAIGVTNLTTSDDLYVDDQLIGGFGAQSTSGSTDWNDTSNARAGSGQTLLRGSTSSNAPSSETGYWHPFSFEYGATKDGGGNLTQFAIPYVSTTNDSRGDIFYRSRYAGSWGAWRKILAENQSGNVGIGLFTPSVRLEVLDNTTNIARFGRGNTSGADAGIAIIAARNSDPSGQTAFLDLSNFDSDELGGTEYVMARVAGGMNDTSGQTGFLQFLTNSGSGVSEAARIDKNGNMGIGTGASISSGLKLDVEGQIGATAYCDENGANCSAITDLGLWTRAGSDVELASTTDYFDINTYTAIGPDAGEPSDNVVLRIGDDSFGGNNDRTTYQTFISESIPTTTLTANRTSYGQYVNLVNNKGGSATNGERSYAYANYGVVYNSASNYAYVNNGAYFEGRNSSSAGASLLRGVTAYGRQYDTGSSNIPTVYGLDAYAAGRGSSAASISNAIGVYAVTVGYDVDVTTGTGLYGIARTYNGYSGVMNTAYGVRGYALSDSDDGGSIDDAYGGYFHSYGRDTAPIMTNSVGVYAEANDGVTSRGVWAVADDARATTNYAVYADARNGSGSNWAVYAPYGDNYFSGRLITDASSGSYDVWIQGGGSFSGGDARNLALLGIESSDTLILNYNKEYTGGVGIGNTSVSADLSLDVEGKVGATEYCDNAGGNCITAANLSSGAGIWTLSGNNISNSNTGNVGIGTTPDSKLHVGIGTPSDLEVRQLVNSNFSNPGIGITFGRTSDSSELAALGVVESNKLGLMSREGISFSVGGGSLYSQTSEQMSLDSSGNLAVSGAISTLSYNKTGRRGNFGTYNSLNVQGIWSIQDNYSVDTGTNNDFGSAYGLVYAHHNAGSGLRTSKKPIAGWGHQIMVAHAGIRNITFSATNGQIATAGICDQEGANCSTAAEIFNITNGTGGSQWTLSGNNISNSNTGGVIVGSNAGAGTSKLSVVDNGDIISLVGTDHAYLSFYPDGPSTRRAYIGFPSASNDNLVINNEFSSGVDMQISSTGNVGIGTSPSYKLHVSAGSGSVGGWFEGTGNIYNTVVSSGTGYARTWYRRNNTWVGSIGSNGSGAFTLSAGGSDSNHLTISSSGNVGIGGAASNRLHVTGNLGSTGWIGAGCEGSCDSNGQYTIMYNTGRIVARGYTSGYAIDGKTESVSHGGVIGYAQNSGVYGILGHANSYGVYGRSTTSYGVYGNSTSSYGGYFSSSATYGLRGHSTVAGSGGVLGYTANLSHYGIVGHANAYSFYGNSAGYFAGAVTAGSFVYASDKKLKTNISTTNGLDTILKLRGVDFDWKEDGSMSTGLIAQEVEEILPHLVETAEVLHPETGEVTDTYKTVQYGNLVAPLIEAVKEQQVIIESLEKRINILENQL